MCLEVKNGTAKALKWFKEDKVAIVDPVTLDFYNEDTHRIYRDLFIAMGGGIKHLSNPLNAPAPAALC